MAKGDPVAALRTQSDAMASRNWSLQVKRAAPLSPSLKSWEKLMVLPDRIELSTSSFITPTLSRPLQAAFVRWTIPSP
jgi:hypothetical protein